MVSIFKNKLCLKNIFLYASYLGLISAVIFIIVHLIFTFEGDLPVLVLASIFMGVNKIPIIVWSFGILILFVSGHIILHFSKNNFLIILANIMIQSFWLILSLIFIKTEYIGPSH